MNRAALQTHLAAQDARLERAIPALCSLAPGRRRATPLAALGAALLTQDVAPPRAEALVEGLSAIAVAQLEHFPETIFWDLDEVASALLRSPDVETMLARAEAIVALQAQFGRTSRLAFRYAHDFTYGFDWARWVRKEPEARAHIGPFDLEFLRVMQRRGEELLALIAANDARYPPLAAGVPRNPFSFTREPEHELRLFLDLAEQELIPMPTWAPGSAPRWDRPFKELRDARARALGIPTKPEGGA